MRGAPFTLALAAALLLAGCAGPAPDPDATTGAASTAPGTTSAAIDDGTPDEADPLLLAASTMQSYLDVSAQVLSQGHDMDDTLHEIAGITMDEDIQATIELAQEQAWTVSGSPVVEPVQLVSVTRDPTTGTTSISAQVCVDMTSVEMRDANGTPTNRNESQSRIPLFVSVNDEEVRFKVIEVSNEKAGENCV